MSCSSPFNVVATLNRSSCGRESVHFHFQHLVEGDEEGVLLKTPMKKIKTRGEPFSLPVPRLR